jgi:hypothetical protein
VCGKAPVFLFRASALRRVASSPATTTLLALFLAMLRPADSLSQSHAQRLLSLSWVLALILSLQFCSCFLVLFCDFF